jgi:hypothetical protein
MGDVVAGSPLTLPKEYDLSAKIWDGSPSFRKKFNFVELHLLSEFVKAHDRTDTFRAFPLEVHVYDPTDELLIEQPERRQHVRSFVIGLCVTQHDEGGKEHIRLFRIRDHLREMGLGRRALKTIIDSLMPGDVRLRDVVQFTPPKSVASALVEGEWVKEFASLFDSIVRDMEEERETARRKRL